MGISILTGVEGGGDPGDLKSIFFCNTKGHAFGPVMPFDADLADEFLTWLNEDIFCDVVHGPEGTRLVGSPYNDIRRLDPETLEELLQEYMDGEGPRGFGRRGRRGLRLNASRARREADHEDRQHTQEEET